MRQIRVLSLDVEGTLATPDFSQAIWHKGIPALYAQKHCLSLEEATKVVRREYDSVGDKRKEWYDIQYWFQRFELGDYRALLEENQKHCALYPEVTSVLSGLAHDYTLVASSATAAEFLDYLLDGIGSYFTRVFSSISQYAQTKNPAFFLTVCQEMDVYPEEVVHVGDSWEFDFLAATGAGLHAFYVDRDGSSGYRDALTSLNELKVKLPGLSKLTKPGE